MTRKKQSQGTCTFCGREMSRGGLSKHLQSCPQRQEAITTADNAKPGSTQPLYHLLVHDAYDSDFWLHLEMNGRATLKDLDHYLRAIWLKCCGHLITSWPATNCRTPCVPNVAQRPVGTAWTVWSNKENG